MMASLASGIVSGIGNAVGAVRDAVGQITDLLPGSPAQTGPLSGQGYALIRGQHLSEDLAAGISSSESDVQRAARDLADLMTLSFDSGSAFDAITTGGSSAGGSGGSSLYVEAGAIVVQVGEGVDPAAARAAFDGADDELADKLLSALQRR